MYLTMITAILLTLYKQLNKIVGWTVAKIKFLDELFVWARDEWKYSAIVDNTAFNCR